MFGNLKEKINPHKVTALYESHERSIGSFFLVGGFILDWLTLQRVDNFWDNLWTMSLIVMIGVSILVLHWAEKKYPVHHNDEGVEEGSPVVFWATNAVQFFFGGVLSAFLVFYFRSADLSTSWPFILILIVVFLGNEYFKQHLARLALQLSMFFFALFCASIFLVPVVIHRIGPGIFVISGLLALFVMICYLHLLVRFSKEKFYESRNVVVYSIGGVFLVMNILYFTNLIPPIPLSLKDSGMYHSVTRNSNGTYTATFEDFGWRTHLQVYKNFYYRPGDTVYAYSAVFSPSSLDINIVHEWERYDEATGKWINAGKTMLPVVGGRDGGFRTYSERSISVPGLWRVNVTTTNGLVIGRLRFQVIETTTPPSLSTKTLK